MWHRCSLNFICHKMFGGVGAPRSEDWQVLTSINRQKRLLASIMPAAERHDGIASALHIATDTTRRPSMFSFPCCGRANGAAHAKRSSRRKDILAKIFFTSADQPCPQSGRNHGPDFRDLF
jgi:hypothetical protein